MKAPQPAGGVDRPTTPAIGGGRSVPVPDEIARDYLLLALRLDQHAPGLIDSYVGPADLKARVDLENPRPPERLAGDAADVRARLPSAIADAARRAWLDAQLVALAATAEVLAGRPAPYLELVRRSFGVTPRRREEATFEAAATEIEGLLPADLAPGAALADRLAAWDATFVIEPERVVDVARWLVDRFRARTAELCGLPAREGLTVSAVRGQSWAAYCWFDGGGRSRIDLNLDQPVRAAELVRTIAHETYPGHHTEHSTKERELVESRGWLEASVRVLETPEALISEGLANVAPEFATAPAAEADLLFELFERAGLTIAADPAGAADAAALTVALAAPRRRLAAARLNAALLRHVDGLTEEAVLDYLVEVGRLAPDRAARTLAFLDHPRWQRYVIVYDEGEALVRQWLAAAPADERTARFGRLLREPLTPGALAAETIDAAEAAAPVVRDDPGAVSSPP